MHLRNHYYLLRHGQTAWRHKNLIYPADNMVSVGLSRAGQKQIRVVTQRLKKERLDLLFSSDFRRTRETSEIVGQALSLKPVFDKRLREIKMGQRHGFSKSDYYRDFPLKSRFQKCPKGGESWSQVRKRILAFLNEVEKKYQGKRILVVGHGDPLWLLEGCLRGWENQRLLNLAFIRRRYIQKGEWRKICPR